MVKTAALSLFLGIMLSLSAGCAWLRAPSQPGSQESFHTGDTAQRTWWHVRYKLAWPEGEAPRWWLDGLLANEIFARAMREARTEPLVWRFHRRAARDATGYQFSFLYYASQQEAANLRAAILDSQFAKELQREGVVERLLIDSGDDPSRTRIAATSDTKWDSRIQEAWPWYAMGASKTWLTLTRSCLPPAYRAETGLDEALTAYREAAACVTALWRAQGQHAFLHHLSALMAYEPLPVRVEAQF